MSVFDKYVSKAYPHNFNVEIVVGRIAGGVPTDPKVAEGWIKTKVVSSRDDLIREEVAQTMVDRGVGVDEATKIVDTNKHLNGFKRNAAGLYIEGRQLKACIKEAASVRWPGERWGPTRKGTVSFFAEHVFVDQDIINLGVAEPSGVEQRFVHTWRGSSIQYEEFVESAKLSFSVCTDYDFKAEEWGLLWLTAQQQGLGASRSQGFGRFEVVKWEKVK